MVLNLSMNANRHMAGQRAEKHATRMPRQGVSRSVACSAGCNESNAKASAHPAVIKAGQFVATALMALTAVTAQPAMAAEDLAPVEVAATSASKTLPETVYFGNGCFWGRQKDYVDTEKVKLGRAAEQISAVVGYAGGPQTGPDGKVCYYYSDPRTVYEKLGHAEVVKVDIAASQPADVKKEFRTFADTYFSQFRKTNRGMQRLDPQDAGPGYRNVVGLPGGVKSPLFQVLQEANVNGMELREGSGNRFQGWGQATEDDLLNVVWVVDSNQLPFYRAEQYHQFHNGIGKAFPKDYTVDLKSKLAGLGRIGPTGCPELPF